MGKIVGVRTSLQHLGGSVNFQPGEVSVQPKDVSILPEGFAQRETISDPCDRGKRVGVAACAVVCNNVPVNGIVFSCQGRENGPPCALSAEQVAATAAQLVRCSGISQ
jgi:hypothetical protein